MKITSDNVIFDNSDRAFVKRFGEHAAREMVLDFKSCNPLPFVYDAYQLCALLRVGYGRLFFMSRHINACYRRSVIKKKNGGDRLLFCPNDELKSVQRAILGEILEHLPISRYATAYRKGVSLTHNASPHVGKKYILKLDITDFFASIGFEQVYVSAFSTSNFPRFIGCLLTVLCTKGDCLPQGAPTSPALSNIVMRRFDDLLGDWCKSRGIAYTRYCDDMTFSSDKPLYRVYQKVADMLENTTFELNPDKTCFVTNASRQTVTGITVNQRLTVPSDYKRRLRQELYYVKKHGMADAAARLGADPQKYRAALIGKINYVLQVEGDNACFKKALNTI